MHTMVTVINTGCIFSARFLSQIRTFSHLVCILITFVVAIVRSCGMCMCMCICMCISVCIVLCSCWPLFCVVLCGGDAVSSCVLCRFDCWLLCVVIAIVMRFAVGVVLCCVSAVIRCVVL